MMDLSYSEGQSKHGGKESTLFFKTSYPIRIATPQYQNLSITALPLPLGSCWDVASSTPFNLFFTFVKNVQEYTVSVYFSIGTNHSHVEMSFTLLYCICNIIQYYFLISDLILYLWALTPSLAHIRCSYMRLNRMPQPPLHIPLVWLSNSLCKWYHPNVFEPYLKCWISCTLLSYLHQVYHSQFEITY